MLIPRVLTGTLLLGLAAVAPAAEPHTAMPRPASVNVLDVVSPAYRNAVSAVVRQSNLTARAADEELTAHATVYDWMLEHPDRVSLAWRRIGVPCVEITDLGDGRFHWADANGSELTWQTVGRFTNGLIWYATGKVKENLLPRPGSLSTHILPPCNSTRLFVTAKPRPTPSCTGEGARWNFSNTFSC